jgi:membrane glycosyltransferase
MVVMDADSVMSGDCLVSLVKLMDAHPRAGILQTAPRGGGHDSLHARAQAFLGRVTGPLFTQGLAYWQLGESHYWGHNAILRVEPFMKHCALAALPGRGGLAGEILSHDFVEAALMRRAGYEVWLVPELDGSYEQLPAHLVDELQRDRRWCQGNLQNARLIAEPGIRPVHRAMFLTGAMSYLASPLWLAFVLAGACLAGRGASVVTHAGSALWCAVLVMLFLPRVLGVAHVLARGEHKAFGGAGGLLSGALIEGVLSALQAPVRMAGHTLFVLIALTGWKLEWKSPSREAEALGWRDAAANLRWLVLPLTIAVCTLVLLHNAGLAWGVAPLMAPLLVAVPLAVFTSEPAVGRLLKRWGVLVIPEELKPTPPLRAARRHVRAWRSLPWLEQMLSGPGQPTPQGAASSASSVSARAVIAGVAMAAAALLTPAPPVDQTAMREATARIEAMRQAQLERIARLQADSIKPVSAQRAQIRRVSMKPQPMRAPAVEATPRT